MRRRGREEGLFGETDRQRQRQKNIDRERDRKRYSERGIEGVKRNRRRKRRYKQCFKIGTQWCVYDLFAAMTTYINDTLQRCSNNSAQQMLFNDWNPVNWNNAV